MSAREQERAWRRSNPDKVNAANRRYYTLHTDTIHAQIARWRAKKDALGLCRVCQNPRGEDGTKTRCRPCADEENRRAKERAEARKGGVPVAQRRRRPEQR